MVRVLTRETRGQRTLELLDGYAPHDDRERGDQQRMFELLATTQHPLARHQFDPGHFTASAFVLSRTHGQVLLIRHPTLGLWLQPGGHIEPGDADAAAAALREVREETGLTASIGETLFDIDIHEIPARGAAPAHLHFDLRFLVTVDGLPSPVSEEGVHARWLTVHQAVALTTDESVKRMVGRVNGARDEATG